MNVQATLQLKKWKRPKYLLIVECINKVLYICAMEYYLAIKRNELLIQATTLTNLKTC